MAVEKIKAKTVNEPAMWIGLAADAKPVTDVDSGDIFYELDTKVSSIYSKGNTNPATSNGWWEV